jgi:hypothetical protein
VVVISSGVRKGTIVLPCSGPTYNSDVRIGQEWPSYKLILDLAEYQI